MRDDLRWCSDAAALGAGVTANPNGDTEASEAPVAPDLESPAGRIEAHRHDGAVRLLAVGHRQEALQPPGGRAQRRRRGELLSRGGPRGGRGWRPGPGWRGTAWRGFG